MKTRDEDIESTLLELFKRHEAAGSATLAKMFNSLGLKVGSRFVAFAHRGGLGIRLSPRRVAEIVSQGRALAFMGSRKRVLRGWAIVPIDQVGSWERLLREAISIEVMSDGCRAVTLARDRRSTSRMADRRGGVHAISAVAKRST